MSSDSRPRLLIATTNAGKIRELAELLRSVLPVELLSLTDFSRIEPVEETGATFAENALLKARFYAARTSCPVLADDSGLEVDALDGAPGVHSARYGGGGASDTDRLHMLLDALAERPGVPRTARFVCALAFADPHSPETEVWTGICEGRIAPRAAGTGGFGYDPVFIPEGFDRTFGELPAETKQRLSHRARALRAALPGLVTRLKMSAPHIPASGPAERGGSN